MGRKRVDGVGKATLFADLLEEPGAHSPTERRGHDPHGEPAGVPAGHAHGPEHDMRLLGRTLTDHDTAGIGVGIGAPTHRGGKVWATQVVDKGRRDQRERTLMVDVAGDRDHRVGRSVPGAVVVGDGVAAQALDGVDRAQHRTPEIGVTQHSRGEDVVDDVARVIVVHGDLLEDHTTLRGHVVSCYQ